MKVLYAVMLCLVCTYSFAVEPSAKPAVTKDALKEEYAGVCRNPEKAFPTPPPKERMDAFKRWCDCLSDSIEKIPDNKMEQVVSDTYEEYAKYKADPKGFVPAKEYSMVRISKACVGK